MHGENDVTPIRLDTVREPKSPQEWVRLFGRANPTWKCLRCNHTEPTVLTPGSTGEDIPLATIDRTTGRMLAYVPILAVVCENCGHIELFDQAIVIKNGSDDD